MEPSPTSDLDVLTTIIRKEMRGVHSRVELRVVEWFKAQQEREDKKWAEVTDQTADAFLIRDRTIARVVQEKNDFAKIIASQDRQIRNLTGRSADAKLRVKALEQELAEVKEELRKEVEGL